MSRKHDCSTPADLSAGVPAIQFERISKKYPNGVHAVKDVSLEVRPGEIHSIIGENGAGKSSLMKVAYGLVSMDSGLVRVFGNILKPGSLESAIGSGLGMVHQNLMLVPSLTLAENIMLGAEPGTPFWISQKSISEYAEKVAAVSGLHLETNLLTSKASVGMRQRAEIVKALGRGAKVLILDEPTAVLTPQETDELFVALRKLCDNGISIVFISHKLNEVMEISDRVSVMRQGALISQHNVKDTTKEQLAFEMVGRSVNLKRGRVGGSISDSILEVKNLTGATKNGVTVGPFSLRVDSHEIVGIAGVEGNGQAELMEMLSGQLGITSGTIQLSGKYIQDASIMKRRELGVSVIPEDRSLDGIAPGVSVELNLLADRINKLPFSRFGMIKWAKVRAASLELIERFRIKTPHSEVRIESLSGGNVQKVILARELSLKPLILLASQPSRGVDIGAMELIYEEIEKVRSEGTGVLLVSADLVEILNLSDRIYIMNGGRIVSELENSDTLSEREVGRIMLGVEAAT